MEELKEVAYGCHCDLEPDQEPDGCVMDEDRHMDCIYATPGGKKEKCEYWKPIEVVRPSLSDSALRERVKELERLLETCDAMRREYERTIGSLRAAQGDHKPVAFDFKYAYPTGYCEASILRGGEQEGRAFMAKLGCKVVSVRPLYAAPPVEQKVTVPEFPTKEQRSLIQEEARRSFRRHKSSVRGQIITELDDPDTHIIYATWKVARDMLSAAPSFPANTEQQKDRGTWSEGVLMAASVLIATHDQPTMAANILKELGLSDADYSDLDDFDKANLTKIQRESGGRLSLRGLPANTDGEGK